MSIVTKEAVRAAVHRALAMDCESDKPDQEAAIAVAAMSLGLSAEVVRDALEDSEYSGVAA